MAGKFVDFSVPRGDREDDEEELIDLERKYQDVSEIKPKLDEQEIAEVKTEKKAEEKPKVKVPRAFDESYYENHIEKAHTEHNHDKKYILYWEQLGRYAKEAYKFYTCVMCDFYKSINQQDKMPDFVKQRLNDNYDLEEVVKKFQRTEEEIIMLLNRQNRDIEKVFEKHKRISELREFTATAWLIYTDAENQKYLQRLVKMQKRFKELNKSPEDGVVAFYAGHTRANYYVPKHFLTFFNPNGDFAKTRPSISVMYKNVNSNNIYENLLMDIDGYNPAREHEIVYETANDVHQETNVNLVELYNNYNDIKYIIKRLNSYDFQHDLFGFEETGNNGKVRDIFKQAKIYYLQTIELINELPNNPTFKRVKEDLEYLMSNLGYVLNKTKELYANYLKENEEFLEKMKNHPKGKMFSLEADN